MWSSALSKKHNTYPSWSFDCPFLPVNCLFSVPWMVQVQLTKIVQIFPCYVYKKPKKIVQLDCSDSHNTWLSKSIFPLLVSRKVNAPFAHQDMSSFRYQSVTRANGGCSRSKKIEWSNYRHLFWGVYRHSSKKTQNQNTTQGGINQDDL